jgi:hypothetical protein
MYSKILVGLATVLGAASIAGPALAQAQAVNPAQPAAPAGAQVKISNLKVLHSRNAGGFTWATVTISTTNMTGQSFQLTYKSNMKTFQPGTPGPWRTSTGVLGFSGAAGGNETSALKFAYKGRSLAQVKKSLKIAFTNPGGGATLTNPTATATS